MWDVRRLRSAVTGFGDGEREPWTNESRQPLETRETQETESPLEAPEREAALPTL